MSEACKLAARQYVAWFNFRVIPAYRLVEGTEFCSCGALDCTSVGKHPMTYAWTTRAAESAADIETLWAEDPEANVGIVTGAASGIWVLDVDLDKPQGSESWERLAHPSADKPRIWQPVRRHVTGGGGFHLVFALPPGVVVKSRKMPGYPGIDIRGDGGFIIAPPSVSGKGTYTTWHDENNQPQPAPEWLLDMVREPAGSATVPWDSSGADPVALPVDTALLPAQLITKLAVAARKGDRSDQFHHRVGLCLEAGLNQGQTLTLLGPWCARCDPPLYLGRVPREIRRSWDKFEAARKALTVDLRHLYEPPPAPVVTQSALAIKPEPLRLPEAAPDVEPGEVDPYAWVPPVVTPDPVLDPVLDELFTELDFVDMWDKVPPEPLWVWEPFLERKRAYSVVSAPKAGKSLLVLEAVGRLCAGQRAPGARQALPPKHIAYIDAENTDFDVIERLRDMDFKPDEVAGYLHIYPQIALHPLDTPDGAALFVRQMKRLGVELVIIDTFARFVEGEEDKSSTVNNFYRMTANPLKRAGIAVLRLDHSGWDDKRERGSSAKRGDVDAIFHLTANKKTGVVRMRTVEQRGKNNPDEVAFRRRKEPLRHEPMTAAEAERTPGTTANHDARARYLVRLARQMGFTGARGEYKRLREALRERNEVFGGEVFDRAFALLKDGEDGHEPTGTNEGAN